MTPEEYEAKREARYNRLLAAAARATSEGNASLEQGQKMFSIIPMGQPIQIGHYSEKADRNYRNRAANKISRGYALHEKAEALRRRAEAAANNHAIFSDDPAASEKLEAKIARLEARQEMMKQANQHVRDSNRDGLAAMGFSDERIAQLLYRTSWPGPGFASFELTNNSANIRRLKDRLKVLAQLASVPTSEATINGVRIVDNADANRLQIFFPGKPSDACRAELKSSGFRWAPSEGAWQRQRSGNATYYAKQIVKKHYPTTEQAAA